MMIKAENIATPAAIPKPMIYSIPELALERKATSPSYPDDASPEGAPRGDSLFLFLTVAVNRVNSVVHSQY